MSKSYYDFLEGLNEDLVDEAFHETIMDLGGICCCGGECCDDPLKDRFICESKDVSRMVKEIFKVGFKAAEQRARMKERVEELAQQREKEGSAGNWNETRIALAKAWLSGSHE
jgi:hypothetical protein